MKQGNLIIEEKIKQFQENFASIAKQIGRVVVGNQKIVHKILLAFFCGGHILLEGLPGLGKTLLVQTFAQSIGGANNRIQFTPDLMPGDILGTKVFQENSDNSQNKIHFVAGPIFSNIILADEINRTTPKTQSALLQAMQEGKVTIGEKTYDLPEPFMVIATQNPIEMEGTYPLPEAQLDRFFYKLEMGIPGVEDLVEIAVRTTEGKKVTVDALEPRVVAEMKQMVPHVAIAGKLLEYAARLVLSTHPTSEFATTSAKRYIKYGASPRAMQAFILGAKANALHDGRAHVSKEDFTALADYILQHRIILNFEGEAEGITAQKIIQEILEKH